MAKEKFSRNKRKLNWHDWGTVDHGKDALTAAIRSQFGRFFRICVD